MPLERTPTIEEAMESARWALIGAIRRAALLAAEFEVSAGNYDRPIAETPWLRDQRYGDNTYDARWYAVMGAKDHFIEGLPGSIDDALQAFAAVAHMAGRGGGDTDAAN